MLIGIPGSSALPWVPVVRGRSHSRNLDSQRLVQAAAVQGLALGPPVVLSGRRRVQLEHLLGLARARTVGGVLLVSLDVVSPRPEEVLSTLAELTAHVPVQVLDAPWAAELGPGLPGLAQYLTAAVQRQRSLAGRMNVAVAKARGVPVGRPRKPVPATAIDLAQRIGVGRASRLSGIPATSLRRALREANRARACSVRIADFFPSTGGLHAQTDSHLHAS